jgi:hypothetical protein
VPAGPSESELRAALETLLEAADLSTLSYSQLHKQLEEKFAVSDILLMNSISPLYMMVSLARSACVSCVPWDNQCKLVLQLRGVCILYDQPCADAVMRSFVARSSPVKQGRSSRFWSRRTLQPACACLLTRATDTVMRTLHLWSTLLWTSDDSCQPLFCLLTPYSLCYCHHPCC